MRGNTEECELVAWSENKEVLLKWYNAQKVEPYVDIGRPSFSCHGSTHHWHKTFAKGGPLEWFNPMHHQDGEVSRFGSGIHYVRLGSDINNQNICIKPE